VRVLASKKSKSKQWFSIVAPKIFDEIEIGRTFSIDPSYLVGRKIVANAMNIVSGYDKYYLKLMFRISSVDGTRALTEFSGSELMREYVSRMVLRRVRRIDLVQDLATKDGTNLRIKSIAVISKKMSTATKFDIAAMIKEYVKHTVEMSTFDDFIKDLINEEIKMDVLQQARKIYPVRHFEIRKVEVTGESSESKRQ
jgi:small subunit ribosomal protein S3Ae